MLLPSEKRKLRDIHLQLTLVNVYLHAMKDRGPPFGQDEIEKLDEDSHRQIERIYELLDPPARRKRRKA